MKQKMLFISSNYPSFIRQDFESLSEKYIIERFEFGSRKGIKMIMMQLHLLFWLCVRIRSATVCFVWFGDYHSFFPTLVAKWFGKKCALVIGGYDAAKLSEYKYGGHVNPLRSWIIKKSCKWATVLLPVSFAVEEELTRRIGSDYLRKSKVVYNGVNVEVFLNKGNHEPITRNGVICVSVAESRNRALVKGLDLLFCVASRMPDEQFTLVGINNDLLIDMGINKTNNVTLIGRVSQNELMNLYVRAKVICQFSRFESFGMALAEGMLSGCIPVTTPGIGATELVNDDCGIITKSYSIQDLTDATERALVLGKSFSENAQKRILSCFGLPQRADKLFEILNDLR